MCRLFIAVVVVFAAGLVFVVVHVVVVFLDLVLLPFELWSLFLVFVGVLAWVLVFVFGLALVVVLF